MIGFHQEVKWINDWQEGIGDVVLEHLGLDNDGLILPVAFLIDDIC